MITNQVPKKIKILIIIFTFFSLLFLSLHKKNETYITLTTQNIYVVFITGLFFINLMICIFLLLYYTSHQKRNYLLILAIAFLSNLYYYLEVAMIALSSVENELPEVYQKPNDIVICYIFRQISFILIVFLAIYSTNSKSNGIFASKKNIIIFILSTLILFLTPVVTKNLTSDNAIYSITIMQYSPELHLLSWNVIYTKIISLLWLLLIVSCTIIRNYSKIWFCIIFISITSVSSNLILIYFIDKPYPSWNLAKGIELTSIIYIASTLMYYIFRELNHANYLATHDPLTSAYNRRYFINSLSEISKNQNNSFSIIMLDIDNFKNINDQWGHHIGDQVLVTVTHTIKKSIRDGDILGRLGGEEFGIIIKNNAQEHILSIAERIRKNIESQCADNIQPHGPEKITVSIGCFIAKHNNLSSSEIFINTDKALYQAKRTGKNKVIIYSE
ncbi:GGDEF domain-containing protein [Escherichia coli]|nr:GGDEF domain-containing protein [Escherichia coli]QMD82401.1 GGDEF domain-containing protein [Escherichia coli]QML61286.1 GGDEF domain-containing protein [Escherichia coli]